MALKKNDANGIIKNFFNFTKKFITRFRLEEAVASSRMFLR